MTREEAINRILEIDIRGPIQEDYDAMNMAIKALEQEPILDKIRDEIDRQEKWLLMAGHNVYNVEIAFDAIKSVLAESEPQESEGKK